MLKEKIELVGTEKPCPLLDHDWLLPPEYPHQFNANTVLLKHSSRAILIDPGSSQGVPDLLQYLDAFLLSPSDIDAIFITDIHTDHAGAAGLFQSLNHNIQTIVTPIQSQIIKRQDPYLSASYLYGQAPPHFRIDHLIKPGMAFDYGPHQLVPLSTPGHSPGSTSFFINNRLGVLGDLLHGGFHEAIESDYLHWLTSLDHVSHVKFDICLDGHGNPIYLPYSRAVFDRAVANFGKVASLTSNGFTTLWK